jgi:hypothetical protein
MNLSMGSTVWEHLVQFPIATALPGDKGYSPIAN